MEKTGCTYLKKKIKSLSEFILFSYILILLSFTQFTSHTYIGASIKFGKLKCGQVGPGVQSRQETLLSSPCHISGFLLDW